MSEWKAQNVKGGGGKKNAPSAGMPESLDRKRLTILLEFLPHR
jgi:hypothetical protein